MVGGHPRTLEYLDALLSGGAGRYHDVTARLTKAVHAKLGRDEGNRWLATARDLDAALAESLTLAADDILLDELLATLPPQAERLLLGASVHREPVDTHALLFNSATPTSQPPIPPTGAAPESASSRSSLRTASIPSTSPAPPISPRTC